MCVPCGSSRLLTEDPLIERAKSFAATLSGFGRILTVLLAPGVARNWEADRLEQYRDGSSDVCQSLEDPWSAQIDIVDGQKPSIIHASRENVTVYLTNIDVLWRLGVNLKK